MQTGPYYHLQVLKKSSRHSRDILAFSYCCEATRFRSRLIQVEYVTSLSCLCPKPASFETSGCMYVYHNICLESSLSLEIEAILFVFNQISERKPNLGDILFRIESHWFLQARSMNRINAGESKKCP